MAGAVILLCGLAFNFFFLAPEIQLGRVSLNDAVLHLVASERLAGSFGHGEPFLDPWVSEWSLGYPFWRSYQPLPHLLSAGVLRLREPVVDHGQTFSFLAYVVLSTLPASVYAGSRLLGLSPVGAGLASVLALAPSAQGEFGRYGLGYGAFVWRGSGLYTQLVALHFLVVALGAVCRVLDSGRRRMVASFLLAATALSHIVFGYVAFASACVLAVVGPSGRRSQRLVRLLTIVVPATFLLAWFVVPLALAREDINHSRWEHAFKWDSFGAGVILNELVHGRLLDGGRYAILSLLLACGFLVGVSAIREPLPRRLVALTGVWLLLFFGRATWGHLLILAAVPADLHLHRLQAAFELSAVLSAAWGLERGIRLLAARRRSLAVVSGAALSAALVYLGHERAAYLRKNAEWGAGALEAFDREQVDFEHALAAVRAILAERPGRVSAGPAAGWGRDFKIGSVPVYALLSREHIDQVSFLYHAMSRTGDIMVLRDENDAAHNIAFGIRAFIAPADRAMPHFLKKRAVRGRFAVYEASPEGYFGLVDIGGRYSGPAGTEYDASAAWLTSPLLRAGVVVALRGDLPDAANVPEVGHWEPLPRPEAEHLTPRGRILRESKDGETYRAEVALERPCYAFVKITWFPGLRARVDGLPTPVLQVTPGFAAVPVAAGRHEVVVRYEPGPLKPVLLVLGMLLFASSGFLVSVPAMHSAEEQLAGGLERCGRVLSSPQLVTAGILCLMVILTLRPLFRGKLIDGHDATEYPPRLVEFQRALVDLHVPPIWAPDLSNGHGQPLFAFAPPLLYVAALVLHLFGLGLTDSLQLALAFLHMAGAVAVYRLARRSGCAREVAVATATVWLCTPYVALDLFVRAAFAESAALAVAPVALLGVLRAVDRPGRRPLVLSALAVSLAMLAHNAIALLLLPTLILVVVASSVARPGVLRRVVTGLASIVGGLGLSAYFWVPALLEKDFVKVHLLRSDFLHWRDHTVSLAQVLWSPWGFGLSVPGAGDGMSFAVGPLHLLLASAGIGCALRAGPRFRRFEVLAFTVAGTVGVWLATDSASAVWSRVSSLQYLAYPWRTLFLPGLFLPLVGMLALARMKRRVLCGVMVLFLVVNLPHTAVKQYLSYDDEYYAPEAIARKGINTTTREEYEPRWVEERPSFSQMKLIGPLEIRAQALRTGRQRFEVVASHSCEVEAATLYYPGWRVKVDDREVPVDPVSHRGTMTFFVPEGAHTVELKLGTTPVRGVSTMISLLTATLLLVLYLHPYRALPLLPDVLHRRRCSRQRRPSLRAYPPGHLQCVLQGCARSLVRRVLYGLCRGHRRCL